MTGARRLYSLNLGFADNQTLRKVHVLTLM